MAIATNQVRTTRIGHEKLTWLKEGTVLEVLRILTQEKELLVSAVSKNDLIATLNGILKNKHEDKRVQEAAHSLLKEIIGIKPTFVNERPLSEDLRYIQPFTTSEELLKQN